MTDVVADSLSTQEPAVRSVLARVYEIAAERVPSATPGTSYGMPALLLRGKGLVVATGNARFPSVYPSIGAVVPALGHRLDGSETTTGSIHCSADRTLPDAVVERLVDLRRAEIKRAVRA
ncbi:iron chaperone [Curtobacterium sp. RRHDQ66]|uniref:iron chaperone n=1 Tax=Curtobacterium guangdongense TaxID=3413380 RepID=UPI003BF14E4A